MTIHSVFEDQVSPSLFEGINARYYRATEIARSFVPNEQFENLIVRQHSLVVGPRGSGKTTLLRMLHPECMRVWEHRQASAFRQKIDFSAAYVATDRVWRQQVEGAAMGATSIERQRFFDEIIALDVMAAMLRTIEIRLQKGSGAAGIHQFVEVGDEATANLAAEIADGWNLKPKFLDLGSLRVAIRRRRIEARQRFDGPSQDAETIDASPRIPWDEAAVLAIEAFESSTGVRDELWALLFDELEIVPSEIRDTILGSTRGMDHRLLLKCSLSPWLSEQSKGASDYDGTVFNDFNVLKLFYGRRAESYEFSRKLISGRLSAAGFKRPVGVTVEDAVFGLSTFSGDDSEGQPRRTAAAYGDNSPLGQVVKELAERDVKFREWLGVQGISHDRLDRLTEKKRAETLRKARNIMIARLEFRRASGLLRSRKTMAMYTGGATMLDICEGNPRLLLGLLLPLLEFYDGKHPIPRQLQADALNQIAEDFYALVDAIPVSEVTQSVPEFGQRDLRSPYREFVDRVAHYFQDNILRGDFNPQPASTFRVPRTASRGLQLIVGRLINMGAIIIVPDRGIKDVLVGEFDQHRVRLCYLIAAREHLPPNIDRPISVHRVLGANTMKGSNDLPGLGIDDV
jgi:hypothetical protein